MEWNVSFEQVAYFIEHYLLALLALAFIAYTVAVQKLTAFNVSLFTLLILNVVHQRLTGRFVELWQDPAYVELAFYLWYTSFAVTDFIYVAICISLIKNLKLQRDRATLYILAAKGMQGIIQLMMMCAELISPNSLDHLYSASIITLNLFMATMAFIMAMRTVVVRLGIITISAKE